MRAFGSRSLPLGVDIAPESISLVAAELARDGSLSIRAARSAPLDAPDAHAADRGIAEALRAAAASLGTKERRCVLAAPSGDVAMRLFRVPPGMRYAEAERAAALEADTVSQLPTSERLVALDPIPGSSQDMLLTVARNSGVERLVSIARAAGLKPVAVDVPLCAWRRALDRADAVLDWSADRVALTVFGDPLGSTVTFPPRLVEDRLIAQVRAALAEARRSGLADVRRLSVLGAPDRLEATVEGLGPDGYAIEPVTLGGTASPAWALAYGLASWALAGRGVVAA